MDEFENVARRIVNSKFDRTALLLNIAAELRKAYEAGYQTACNERLPLSRAVFNDSTDGFGL